MLRRTSPYFFYYSWQSATLEKIQKEKNYTSPVWVEQSDLRWIAQAVCPLSEGASGESGGHQLNRIPIRLTLFNLKQFAVENAITESDCPPGTVLHSSFSTKKPYMDVLQSEFEQRAVLHSLKGQESEKKNVEKKDDAAQQVAQEETAKEKRLPSELFWITPREVSVRKFRPKSKNEEPFAVLTQGSKVLFNASQFVDPKAVEHYPTDAASGRPLPSHHQAQCSSWLEAYLPSLESGKATAHIVNSIGLFATKTHFEELGFKLKANAEAVVVCDRYSPKFLEGKFTFIEKLEAKKEQLKQPKQQNAVDLAKTPKLNSDVIHYSFIANQDALWERSRIGRPDETQQQKQQQGENNNKHVIVPQGFNCFPNMTPRLDAFLEKYPEQTKGIKMWVTRKTFQSAGYQLIFGGEDKDNENDEDSSKWISSSFKGENATDEGTLDSQISSAKANREEMEKMKVEYYHISQCEEPFSEGALKKVGLHTR